MTTNWPTIEEETAAIERAAAELARRKRDGMAAAIAWNNAYPVGTWVVFWPGTRIGPGRLGKTRSEAWVLTSGDPVVMVTGATGGIALSHVEAETFTDDVDMSDDAARWVPDGAEVAR